MNEKTWRINGPGTRTRTRKADYIQISPSGALTLWSRDFMTEALAPDQWSVVYEDLEESKA